MKTVKAELSRELKNIEIHTFADLHIGDRSCDIDGIKADIEYVQNTPNAFAILNGDLCNNATKTSVSDCYAESLTPMQQIEKCVELFAPIKDKILCITSGNHENRTYNKEGIDITRIVCQELGIVDRYGKEGCLLFLRFGENTRGAKETNGSGKARMLCYTLYVTHGSGGGKKEGAKAIRLADMASIVDADIYIHSHTHLPMIMKEAFYRTDCRNSSVAIVDKLFVNTSARLNYGGYGQMFEFKPSSKDTPTIYLCGTKKKMNARL